MNRNTQNVINSIYENNDYQLPGDINSLPDAAKQAEDDFNTNYFDTFQSMRNVEPILSDAEQTYFEAMKNLINGRKWEI